FDIDRRQGRSDAVARHELNRIERAPVAGDAAVGARTAVHVFKGEARHMPAGMAAPISDGREAPMPPDEARNVGPRVVPRRAAGRTKAVVSCMRCPCLFPRHYSNGTRRATSVSPASRSAAKGRRDDHAPRPWMLRNG